ncbi:Sec39 domain-containing protein [Lipomyces oligophaga]|uniref:Sec39 domain-containing protein n=1 Tax=Lipomyces oligophaga TaxID=45792 RepID=UPI0034CEBDA7
MRLLVMAESIQNAKLLLYAVYWSSIENYENLRVLFSSSSWISTSSTADALHIILKYVPPTADPEPYVSLVSDISYGTLSSTADDEIESRFTSEALPAALYDLDESIASTLITRMAILSSTVNTILYQNDSDIVTITKPVVYESDPAMTFSSWLFARIYMVDSTVGIIDVVDKILSVSSIPETVVRWRNGVLLPLKKFCDLYPEARDFPRPFSLHDLTSTDPAQIIAYLLQYCNSQTIVRDITTVLVPYIEMISESGQQKLHAWRRLFEWIIQASESHNVHVVGSLIRSWDGPDAGAEVQLEYMSAMIAACYKCPDCSTEVFDSLRHIQKRASNLLSSYPGIKSASTDISIVESMQHFSNIEEALEFPASPLFSVSPASIQILDHFLTSASMISAYIPVNIRKMTELRFFSSHESQFQFLLKMVKGDPKQFAYRDDTNWRGLRSGTRWLKNKSLVLGKLSEADIDNIFLGALLESGRISLATQLYVDPLHPPLAPEDMEKHVLKSFQEHYDTASNCNATRGSLKVASQILHLVYPAISASENLYKADILLKATHEISKYSLTLVPGIPVTPHQLRTNGNPEEIVSQVLQSNEKAYLQADVMISIAQNLTVGFGLEALQSSVVLKGENLELESSVIADRITRMCIYSALASDDFKTAYDYCMARLWTRVEEISKTDVDLVWQTFYAAGRYVSPNSPQLTPQVIREMGNNRTSLMGRGIPPMMMLQISNRVKAMRLQMDLLARAMDLCPDQNIREVLNVWHNFELEVTQLVASVR